MSLATVDSALVPQQAAPASVAGPVTLRDELALWQDAFEFAKAIAPTELVPKAYRNNPPAVMACIIKGHELGVPALHALSQIDMIEGRPALRAELQRALIVAKGHELWTEDFTITRVTLCGRRHDGQHVQKVTWTIEDAKRANLAGKPVWRQYPRAMLLARCSGELGRLMFADVLAGLGVNAEELTDGVIEVLGLEPGSAPEPAAKPTTRRTTRAAKSRTARPGTAAQGPSGPAAPGPGGPPPPLPGEDGHDESAPQSPQDESRHQPTTATAERPGGAEPAPDPVESGDVPDGTDEPAEVVTKRAQSIAMRAQRASVDHHHVIAAVTGGNKTSAKAVTAAEADAVLHALVDLKAGRLELLGSDEDGWHLVEPDPEAEAAGETKTEEYQRRIRELRDQRAELDRGGQQTLDDQDDPT